jgi:hypothetical protein
VPTLVHFFFNIELLAADPEGVKSLPLQAIDRRTETWTLEKKS